MSLCRMPAWRSLQSMTTNGLCPPQSIDWRSRCEPLPVRALAALGDVQCTLARRLHLQRDSQWRALVAAGATVLIGRHDELPWIDGGLYLGADPVAPQLLMPIWRRPAIGVDLVERALRKRAAVPSGRLAVLPAQNTVLDLREIGEIGTDALLDRIDASISVEALRDQP